MGPAPTANASRLAAFHQPLIGFALIRFCPSDFNEYAEVQQVSEVSDGAGGYTDDFTFRVGVWCIVEAAGGGESIVAGRLEHSEGWILTTHYNDEIQPTDRVKMDEDIYKITRLENVDRRGEWLRIYVETGRT